MVILDDYSSGLREVFTYSSGVITREQKYLSANNYKSGSAFVKGGIC
jgi:hypothetical protein